MDKGKKGVDIELRSEEFQEIVQQSPRWMIRSGVSLISGVLLLVVIGSYFFRYPDVINASIVVLSENPPVYLAARTTARIDSLLVIDGQMVSDNQIIGILENTANFRDALKVNDFLSGQESFHVDFDTLPAVRPETDLRLGDIQSDYSGYVRLYNDYLTFLRLKLHPQKIKSLRQQVSANRLYCDRLWAQKVDMEADFRLAGIQFKRDSLLQVKAVLSELDVEKSKTLLIQKKYNLNGVLTKLAETQSLTLKLEQELVDAELAFAEQTNKLQNSLIESVNVLKSRLAFWEQTFIIRSPIAGKVSFTNFWSKNQQVKKDERIFTVIPEVKSQIIGRLSLPVQGAGKVRAGQRVNIRFDNYPSMEYGFLEGYVKTVSLIPDHENYIVEVGIPQDMKTNYRIALKFSQEMKGSAEIITEDLRLIQRFINPAKSLMKHRLSLSE